MTVRYLVGICICCGDGTGEDFAYAQLPYAVTRLHSFDERTRIVYHTC